MNSYSNRKPKCINGNMFLSAFDVFVPVNTLDLVGVVRGSDAPGINDTNRGLRVTTGLFPDNLVKHSHDKLNRSVSLPAGEVVINGIPCWEIGGEHAPLTSSFDKIKEWRLQHLEGCIFACGTCREDLF